MSANPPTLPRARDLALARKRSLRTGRMVLGYSVPFVADRLGVEDDTVEAWESETRPNHVPGWIEDHPGLPRPLRDWLRSESDRSYGDHALSLESPEAQAATVMRTMGHVFVAMASVLDVDHIGHELAAQLIAIGERHVTAMTAWLARLRQRVVTRGHRAAGGSA